MKTAVVFVLDESGSMNPTADDTRGAVNQYFKTLSTETPDAKVSLMKFSDGGSESNFRVLCQAVEPSRVPFIDETNYRPSGNTPLFDAIAKAIIETERVEAEKYVLIILSDALENASREFSSQAVTQMIEAKQAAENWTIVYLGANQDAILTGAAIGIPAGNTMSYAQTSRGITNTMSSVARATGTYTNSAAGQTDSFFADAGRQTKADYEDPTLWTPEKDKPEGGK